MHQGLPIGRDWIVPAGMDREGEPIRRGYVTDRPAVAVAAKAAHAPSRICPAIIGRFQSQIGSRRDQGVQKC